MTESPARVASVSSDGEGAPSYEMPPGASDLVSVVAEFFSELMGLRSGYGIDQIARLSSAEEVDAVLRLRLSIFELLVSRGWQAPAEELAMMERDRALLREGDMDERLLSSDGAVQRSGTQGEDGDPQRPSKGRQAVPPEVELRQMRQAIQSRAVIEQAKGIAMERYGLPASTAWSWLVRTSQQRNEKLRDLAQHIVDSVAGERSSDGQPSRS
ncbi:MAG: ANTAR domain-containing protein [Actinomycetes bacterium]